MWNSSLGSSESFVGCQKRIGNLSAREKGSGLVDHWVRGVFGTHRQNLVQFGLTLGGVCNFGF